MSPELIGILAALGSAASWALGAVLFKRVGEIFSPLAMTLLKATLSVVLLGVAVLVVGWTPLDGKTWWLLIASGLLGIGVADALFFTALRHLKARDMVVLAALGQVFTVLLAILLLGERPTRWQWLGIGGVVAGVATVLWPSRKLIRQNLIPAAAMPTDAPVALLSGTSGNGPNTSSHVHGVILGLLSGLCMSISLIIAKLGVESVSALQGTLIRMAAGAAGLLVAGLLLGQLRQWVMPLTQARVTISFFFAIVTVTFGGFWLSLLAIKKGNVSINSTLIGTEPLFALPLAAVVLGERITIRALIGTAVTAGGVALLCLTQSA